MTDQQEQDRKKVLSLSTRGKLELKKGPDTGQVRQSFSHGRSKTVQVEVKRKRTLEPVATAPAAGATAESTAAQKTAVPRQLTDVEREARVRALRGALVEEEKRSHDVLEAPSFEQPAEPEPEIILDADALRQRELEELRRIQDEERRQTEEAERKRQEEESKRREAGDVEKKADEERRRVADRAGQSAAAKVAALMGQPTPGVSEDEEEEARARAKRGGMRPVPAKPVQQPRRGADRRRTGKITVTQALNEEDEKLRVRSLAAMRRARERERRQLGSAEQVKVTREVIIPDVITVQELANRMAERAGDVIKSLMRSGVLATITQTIDADTAELIANEFGHRVRRVSEADVLLGIAGEADNPEDLVARPPVVTIMGHVDHGKTSLLDAIRRTDVAAGEAGGITQHIGAYQVTIESGERITFIDTPGHAAFTEMRARGANITDVVVLVVAADDGIMPQTIEAINHAQAAKVPIVVAINKSDLPDANPTRVRQELLNHNLVVEELGGDILAVEVSARTKQGIDQLLEGILLQAEILELRANPNRTAVGTVVEAKLERGRGSVATVLVQRGTLQVGEIFVAGGEWGRVRAMINDRGQNIYEAGPAMPVEVLGLNGSPMAGDDFVVVESEARAREIAEFRQRKKRDAQAVATSRGTLEQMFSQIQAGEKKELAVIVKGDVHGSVEAISGALQRMGEADSEVSVRVLHTGVGPVNESDVTLAKASNAIIAGFNVRANAQARDVARRDGIEIRYYSVIYDILDDVRALLTGLLAPTLREQFLGNAAVREVFNITRVGKVAGCMVTEGVVRRGAKVRLLRDNVVIHEGSLKTLKRFKDEVREVREGFECGMAFENYDNVEVGDVIEAFEIQEVARQLA